MKRLKTRQTLPFLLIAGLLTVKAWAQKGKNSPGAQPYTPTRIDWLVTTLQASLRTDPTTENNFSLNITERDAETVLIYVRYLPDVNRERMNLCIDTARQVIAITAKSYGWQDWVVVREDVALSKP